MLALEPGAEGSDKDYQPAFPDELLSVRDENTTRSLSLYPRRARGSTPRFVDCFQEF